MGDCYLIAELNAIKHTKDGDKILSRNIQKTEKGLIVTLPGAVMKKKQIESSGKKTNITGVYYIPNETLEKAKAQSGGAYARGDLDVIALELAIEAYYAEARGAIQSNLADAISDITGASVSNKTDYINGGTSEEVEFLLTGVNNNMSVKKNQTMLFDDTKYKRISRRELDNIPTQKPTKKPNTSNITKKLDSLQGNEHKFAIKAYVTCAKNGKDGVTKAGGNHAVTVLKITNDYVYIENPWHLQEEDSVQVIPRKEFEAMTYQLNATEMDITSINDNYRKINYIKELDIEQLSKIIKSFYK